jgi:hypothetical protein
MPRAVIVLVLAVVGLAACRAGTAPPPAVAGPIEILRKGNEESGRPFRMQLARAAERATKRAAGRNSIMFDEEMVLDELGGTTRGRVSYRGQVHADRDDFDGVRVEGEQRQYYHPQGALIIDAVCAPKASSCDGRTAVLDATESAVLDNLGGTGVDALLPERGRCDVPLGATASALQSCELPDGVVLTVQRLSLDETRQALRTVAANAAASR